MEDGCLFAAVNSAFICVYLRLHARCLFFVSSVCFCKKFLWFSVFAV